MSARCLLAWLVVGWMLATASGVRAELKPDELLLVVNGNSGDSVRIAEFYAKARLIPDGRICKLDLPGTEEIPFEVYEKNVVPQVRKFLTENNLKDKVKCLVTFYGTPIRVAAVKIGPGEEREISAIKSDFAAAQRRLISEIAAMERYVRTQDPTFTPRIGGGGLVGVDDLAARADEAGKSLLAILNRTADPAQRQAILTKVKETYELLLGDAGALERFSPIELKDPSATEATRQAWKDCAERVKNAKDLLARARERRYDPTQRAHIRQLVRETFGLFNYVRTLQGQIEYFDTEQSQSAFDSELALMWHDNYPRAKWVANPLHYSLAARYAGPPVMMTARIDGPDEATPSFMILASLKAERDGLRGRVVIDSRGLHANTTQPSNNSYATYDQTLRNLEQILRTKTKLSVLFDDREQVLASGTARAVAIYCGWYSVGNYVPACSFVTGAVGFHIASFEMVSLKDPKGNGWVKGLLSDGVVATTGPVAEPYLFAFPDADEFFPLLLTGQLTLAEVYFKTQRTLSWQMSLVGDPLYRPFATNPALSGADLPERLRVAIPAVPPGPPAILGLPGNHPSPSATRPQPSNLLNR